MDREDRLPVTDQAGFAHRVTLYRLHLQSAVLFARQAHDCEERAKVVTNPMGDPIFEAHQSYIIGAIFASVAFVEALINEFFIAATERRTDPESLVAHLDAGSRHSVAQWWAKDQNQQAPMLKKYHAALLQAGKQGFEAETPRHSLYTQVDALRQFRNGFVHHKARMIPASVGYLEKATVETILQAHVAFDPLSGSGASEAAYPVKYLSYSCARWAVTTSRLFVVLFFERLLASRSAPPTVDHLRALTDNLPPAS